MPKKNASRSPADLQPLLPGVSMDSPIDANASVFAPLSPTASDTESDAGTGQQSLSSFKGKVPWRVYLYVMLSALGGVLFGFEVSVISGAKELFLKQFDVTRSFETGFVASAMTIGAALGTILAGPLQDSIGRKVVGSLACFVYTGAAVISATSNAYGVIVLGRIVTGVAIGLFSSTIFIYTAELSPPHIRGSLLTINQLFICAGILIGYVVNKLEHQWRAMLLSGIPIAGVLLLSLVFVTPRSPRWLLLKKREMEAYKVLNVLRGSDQLSSTQEQYAWWVHAEVHEIKSTMSRSTHAWTTLRQPHVVRALWCGVMLSAIQQFTGVNAINFYAQTVLKDAGFDTSDSLTYSIYIGVVKVVFVLVGLALMDRAGRKTLLYCGLVGMVASVCLLATILYTNPGGHIPTWRGWTAACSLFAFMGFFEIGLGPIVWILISEFYPLSVRGVAMSVGATANWVFTFITGLTFPPLRHTLGIYGVFYLYGAVGLVSIFFIRFGVPETRGRTLEEIEDLFKPKGAVTNPAPGSSLRPLLRAPALTSGP